MEHVRINVRRLTALVIYSLVLPLSTLLLLDYVTGWFPWLTIAACVICIPLSTLIVIRATLVEMDRVIELVAPLESGESNVEQQSQ